MDEMAPPSDGSHAEWELKRQRRALEELNRLSVAISGELDRDRLVQLVVDGATGLVGAAFGAFFHNVTGPSGDAYTLYVLSGVPRETFAGFPMPRSTAVFAPTFRGEAVVRVDDITQDPRYGRNPPYHGMPKGHLPVRSYLAVPVVARTGEVVGGLFFGHPEPGRFDILAERLVVGIAAQAAVAIENADLYRAAQREIEERRRAEAALQASEARFRAIVEDQTEFISRFSPDFTITFVNRAYATQLGRPREALIGTSLLDLMTEAQQAQFKAQLAALTPDSPTVSYEMDTVLPDGSPGWEHWTDRALFDEAGCVVEYQSVGRDITHRRWADEALRASEEQLRLALEASRLGTWDIDLSQGRSGSGRRTFNARFREMFGFGPEEEITPDVGYAHIHPDDRAATQAKVDRALAPGSDGHYEAEYRALLPDGSVRWHLAKARVFFSEDGRRPLRLVGTVMDITERKEAEETLRKTAGRLAAILDTVVDGIITIDEQGTIETVNPAALRLFACTAEELLGRNIKLLMPEPHRSGHDRYLADYLRTGERRIIGIGREVEGRRKDGSVFPLELAVSETRLGERRLFTGILRDVTERKAAQERQRLLIAELNHRVKNTLAVVYALAVRSLAEGGTAGKGAGIFVERLAALTRAHDLLTASGWQGADLQALAAAGLGAFGTQVTLRGEALMLGPKAAQTLALLLHELATNAAKHGALSRPEGRVELAWRAEEGGFRLVWREQGGPPVQPPEHRGFGRTLVERMVAYELGGEARLEFADTGVRYELRAPIGSLTGAA